MREREAAEHIFEQFAAEDEKANGRGQTEAPWPEDEGGTQGTTKPFPLEVVLSASEFNKLEFPNRPDLVVGVIPHPSLSMIFSWRGVGKTRLALSLGKAVATGENFLAWETSEPRRVLYVDGELPGSELQNRGRDIYGNNPPELLELIGCERFFEIVKTPLVLSNAVHQSRFLALLEALKQEGRGPEVIILDNLSCLTHGVDENSNSEQDGFLHFLIRLRHSGYSVVFLHHAGKSGEQRGATRREDLLDLSIKLVEFEGPRSENARFRMEFSKCRRKFPKPSRLECELIEDQDGRLTWLTSEPDQTIEDWVCTLRFVQSMKPATQAEICERRSKSKATISRHISEARKKGFLEPESLIVTGRGASFLAKIYGG